MSSFVSTTITITNTTTAASTTVASTTVATRPPINSINSINSIGVKNIRGIPCISIIPHELVFSKAKSPKGVKYGLFLECNNCIRYASYRGILCGLCLNCLMVTKYKYGIHNPTDEYTSYVPFGGYTIPEIQRRIDEIIEKNELPTFYQDNHYLFNTEKPILTAHIYYFALSVYQLAALFYNEPEMFNILCEQIKNKDSSFRNRLCDYYFSQNKYIEYAKVDTSEDSEDSENNCNPKEIENEALYIMLDDIFKLSNQYDPFDRKFSVKCENLENFYKIDSTPLDYENIRNIRKEDDIYYDKLRQKCGFCDKPKYIHKLLKCGDCKEVAYCSMFCQTHDWNARHKTLCKYMKDDAETIVSTQIAELFLE